MAKGFGAVDTAKDDIARRKEAGGGGVRYFRLADGETAIVRFLEEKNDVNCGWVHLLKLAGRSYPLQVPCRDQDDEGRRNLGVDCPGCEQGHEIKFRGKINMIQRDAPTSEKIGEKWEVVGNADAVVVWDTSFEVLQDLQEKDVDFGGLKSRDFKIKRRGSKFDTKYSINPADPDGGQQSMSDKDKELEDDKFDLVELVTPQSYESWGVRVEKPKQETVPARHSPFSRRTQEEE